ncbi:hypothetical protein D3C80_1667560 [compost metagenome]
MKRQALNLGEALGRDNNHIDQQGDEYPDQRLGKPPYDIMVMVEGKREHRGYADLRDGLDVNPAGGCNAYANQQNQQEGDDSDIQEASHNQADGSAKYYAKQPVTAFFQGSLHSALCNQNRRQRCKV